MMKTIEHPEENGIISRTTGNVAANCIILSGLMLMIWSSVLLTSFIFWLGVVLMVCGAMCDKYFVRCGIFPRITD
jgi:hypothetical protein